MRKVAVILLLLWTVGLGLGAERKAKSTSASRKVVRPASPKKSVAGKASTRTSKKKAARRRSVPSWKRGQQEPAPERYAEIQQALIDKGYLQGPAAGKWGPESVDALKRFQQDQKLVPTGKLDALSLIGLGLGPNRDQSARNSQVTAGPTKEEP